MYTVHLVLAIGAAALAAMAALASAGRRDHRLITIIACVALVLGHAASLLPQSPPWYSTLLIFATIAGFGWVTWTLADTMASARDTHAGHKPGDEQSVDSPEARRAQLRVVNAIADTSRALPGPVNITSIIREEPRRLINSAQLLAVGPIGAERVTGSTYVAANLVDYIDADAGTGMAQAHRRAAAAGVPSDAVDPRQRLRMLQVRAAYLDDRAQGLASRDIDLHS